MVVVAVAFALLGLWLVRRSGELEKFQSHHEVAGFLTSVVGVIYAVILASPVLTAGPIPGEIMLVAGRGDGGRGDPFAPDRTRRRVLVNPAWGARRIVRRVRRSRSA